MKQHRSSSIPDARASSSSTDADDEDGGETDVDDFAKKVILRGRHRELMKLETREQLVAFFQKVGVHPGLAGGIWASDRESSWH